MISIGGRALNGLRPVEGTKSNQTPNADTQNPGVRLGGISFLAERETTLTAS